MKRGICAYCGQDAELVKSHIIPKGLYWGLQSRSTWAPSLVSPFDTEYQKRQPIGFYDCFLCDIHEKIFNEWDSYAVKLLRDTIPASKKNGWIFENVDYDLIKLFFISLLWRANTTRNIFFEGISLGSHAERLKKLIGQKDSSSIDNYSVTLWRSEESIAKAIIAPYRERYEGVSFCRFYLPGYMALIKVDKRPFPQNFELNSLNKSSSWFVSDKKYAGEGEERVMVDIARKNLERKQRTRKQKLNTEQAY